MTSDNKFPARFPADVWGVIAEYASETPQHALLTLACVHSAVDTGVKGCDPLWLRFSCLRWPTSTRRAGTFIVYRGRCRAANSLAPIRSSDLHPIEHCHVEFACPYFSEGKGIRIVESRGIPELENDGHQVYYCSICNDHVFTVTSQEQLDALAAAGRCIMAPAEFIHSRPDAIRGTAEVLVCATTEDDALRFIRAMKSAILDAERYFTEFRPQYEFSVERNEFVPKGLEMAAVVSSEGDNFVWKRMFSPSVRIRAFWSTRKKFDATAPQTSLLLVVNDKTDETAEHGGWLWPRSIQIQQAYEKAEEKRFSRDPQPLYLGRIETVTTPEAAVELVATCFPREERGYAGKLVQTFSFVARSVDKAVAALAEHQGELRFHGFTCSDEQRGPLRLTESFTAAAEAVTVLDIRRLKNWCGLAPEMVLALPNLVKLLVNDTACDSFPAELFTLLPLLEELTLDTVAVDVDISVAMSSKAWACPSLTCLNIRRCSLQHFPAEAVFAGSPKLHHLDLSGNPLLSGLQLPQSVGCLAEMVLDNREDLIAGLGRAWSELQTSAAALQVQWALTFPVRTTVAGGRLWRGTKEHLTKLCATAAHRAGIRFAVLAGRGLELAAAAQSQLPWLALPMDDCLEAELASSFSQACRFMDRALRGGDGDVLVCGETWEDSRESAVIAAYMLHCGEVADVATALRRATPSASTATIQSELEAFLRKLRSGTERVQ